MYASRLARIRFPAESRRHSQHVIQTTTQFRTSAPKKTKSCDHEVEPSMAYGGRSKHTTSTASTLQPISISCVGAGWLETTYIHPRPHHPSLMAYLDHQFPPCTHDVVNIAEPTQAHRNVEVSNRLHQNLFYACLAGDGEAVHKRPTDWSGDVSENLGPKKKV